MKRSKLLCWLLVGVMLLTNGCAVKKENKVESNEHTLEIEVYNAGYGVEWVHKLADKFEAANPGYDVVITETRSFDMAESILKSGPKNNTADIMIYQYPYYMSLVSQRLSDGGEILADLTDVYESVADGETKTVKERIDSSLENIYNYNGTGKYYAFPTLNDTNGLAYNATMFKENSWEVPMTTDELLELADNIKDNGKGVKPFAWIPGYWEYCTSVWWAQYEGLEKYEAFYRPDYSVKPTDSASGYNQEGRELSLTVLQDLLNPTSGYSIDGCLTLEFSEIQAAFVKQNKAAMMPNGGWMIHEMKEKSYGEHFAMMKVPVISALGNKLGISENTLRELIQYIDGGESGDAPAFTSRKGLTNEEVISAVREARYLNSSSIAYTNVALVPAYSDALEIAKQFLLYTTTKEAMQITFENSSMMPVVSSEIYDMDTSKLNQFDKSKVELMKASQGRMVSMELANDPIFYMNGLRAYTMNGNIVPDKSLAASAAGDRRTAVQIIESERTYIDAQWEHYCKIANEVLGK